MSFLGLGHDDRKDPRLGLPPAPPNSAGFAPQTTNLPPVPPKRPSLFDKEHRQDSLLAIGSALLGSMNFGEGVAAAGQNLLGLKKQMRAEQVQGHEYGGPDNSFDISIDPKTGVRTATPNVAFQNYLEDKRTKQKDVADINGRAMSALQAQPEDQRPAIYAQMIANPAQYGIDPRTMPQSYDPIYAATTAQMGQTVAQASAAQARAGRQQANEEYRAGVARDREARTGIYRDRAAATTRQGDARLGQGAQRIGLSRAAGARAAAGKKGTTSKRAASNSDLSYIQ